MLMDRELFVIVIAVGIVPAVAIGDPFPPKDPFSFIVIVIIVLLHFTELRTPV